MSRTAAILLVVIALGAVALAPLVMPAASTLSSVDASDIAPKDLLASWQVVDYPPALPGEGGLWVEREGHLAQNGVKPAASLSAAETALLSPDTYGDVTVSTAFYDISSPFSR